METNFRMNRNGGFTLVETMVSVVVGAVLMASLYQLWTANQRTSLRLGNKSDFRNRATLATTQVNRSVTMAGYGMSKMDVLFRSRTEATDTLIVYSNPADRRTTLRDTARVGTTTIVIVNDTGFSVGSRLGITDSIQQEYALISNISGDSTQGYTLTLSGPLQHRYNPGTPDVYPVQREKFYIDHNAGALIRRVDQMTNTLASGMSDFRIDLMDASGAQATSYRLIRVVTFSMTGTYKVPAGNYNTMRFSSTVIPRNIL
ncbi:MAG: prepilin-type N-terminal cleavage/methylation domain-containing protein [Fibrobacteres bacterium]|nr:prepilin-type N-terminal cleavage/methylation domain-containing protein [Fibrobacterota bacterium]